MSSCECRSLRHEDPPEEYVPLTPLGLFIVLYVAITSLFFHVGVLMMFILWCLDHVSIQ